MREHDPERQWYKACEKTFVHWDVSVIGEKMSNAANAFLTN
jgi:hypothetical protein